MEFEQFTMNFLTEFMQKYRRYTLWITVVILSLTGCAYFNTFYNAEQYYIKAEKIRLENAGKALPVTAIDSYNKVIEKAKKVLEQYPDSKYHDPALLLIGKAKYYKREYKSAEQIFRQLQQKGLPEYSRESEYWLALCKWKFGKIQPALDDLTQILENSHNKKEMSSIYLSLADIYLEINEDNKAFESLEEAAKLSSNDSERGQIYNRIANLAYERGDLKRALSSFKKVMKYSLSKTHIEEANIMTVRIYRETGELEKASDRIKIMLLDDSFSSIHADLELELVKLYQARKEWDQALTRLASITETYPKTAASAEAYYLLGEYELFHRWNLEEAKKYYSSVNREDRRSEKGPASGIKVKQISAYLETAEELKKTIASYNASLVDTVSTDSAQAGQKEEVNYPNEISGYLISLAELEAFHLGNVDSAIVHLRDIVENYQNTDAHLRSLFTLSYLVNQKGDTEYADTLELQLLDLYPKSDYSAFIRKKNGLEETTGSSAQKLLEAESQRKVSVESAIPTYMNIVAADSTSESSLLAGYFLADYYDYSNPDPENALKFYDWIERHFPESDQAENAKVRYAFITNILQPAPSDTTQVNEKQ